MATVRRYNPKDKELVQEICLRAADSNDELNDWNSPVNRFILATYNDYYTEQEPHNCFVSVDENDTAIGYIICAVNCRKWARSFMKNYYPRVRAIDRPSYKISALGEIFIHTLFSAKYPAHLHIDMSKAYRGQGIGTAMMDELTAHLRRRNVKGVQLVVGADNPRGINFYKKYGFKPLITTNSGVAMGLDLREKKD